MIKFDGGWNEAYYMLDLRYILAMVSFNYIKERIDDSSIFIIKY